MPPPFKTPAIASIKKFPCSYMPKPNKPASGHPKNRHPNGSARPRTSPGVNRSASSAPTSSSRVARAPGIQDPFAGQNRKRSVTSDEVEPAKVQKFAHGNVIVSAAKFPVSVTKALDYVVDACQTKQTHAISFSASELFHGNYHQSSMNKLKVSFAKCRNPPIDKKTVIMASIIAKNYFAGQKQPLIPKSLWSQPETQLRRNFISRCITEHEFTQIQKVFSYLSVIARSEGSYYTLAAEKFAKALETSLTGTTNNPEAVRKLKNFICDYDMLFEGGDLPSACSDRKNSTESLLQPKKSLI